MDHIFDVEGVPTAGQRVFGTVLGRYPGGIGANQAVEIARQLPAPLLFGAVGRDGPGGELRAHLAARGVCPDFITIDGTTATGQTYMYLVAGKQDYFSVVACGANSRPGPVNEWLAAMAGGLLLVSLETDIPTAEALVAKAPDYGVETCLIPAPAECCTPALLAADHIVLNQREAELLLGLPHEERVADIAKRLAALPGRNGWVLLTLGKDGALLRMNGEVFHAPVIDFEVLDSVGAGDAATGAFVAALELGLEPRKALCYGCIAGSLTVSVAGPQSSPHTPADLEYFYHEYYEKDRK